MSSKGKVVRLSKEAIQAIREYQKMYEKKWGTKITFVEASKRVFKKPKKPLEFNINLFGGGKGGG